MKNFIPKCVALGLGALGVAAAGIVYGRMKQDDEEWKDIVNDDENEETVIDVEDEEE